ncbi:hypothetical protein [Arcobacter defluvii]|jgi:hypothetical protein|uniref:Relaxase n=1 Tax=Arcobacter defluvii TaxID=873191 RepID=A0AAE7BFT7_9BACT|nr:hypothetical protein [Arcobacter defluvii]MDY0051761.1 hypothetical protein [Aliarcobacter sp.]QKF78730.1 hypothetical protein ADFLV_2758 [Arcobacter defluvii]RXI33959.1 hypothetical protein CP964_03745 [Arcobacter defluvii]
MRNYSSVTSRGVNKNFLELIYEHNVNRLKKGQEIDYLLNKEDSLGNRSKILIGDEFINLESFNQVKENLDKLEEQRQQLISKRENSGDYLQNHLIEFVVALSEEQSNYYLDNDIDLSTGIEKFIENLNENYGIKTLMYSEHFDEGHYEGNEAKKNLHYHIIAYNYHLEKEKSILGSFTKQDFRDLQDLAAISFQQVELDFQRGISKNITKKEHLETLEFALQKQKIELEQLQKRRKEEYYLAKSVKNDIKDLRQNFERDSFEFEQLTNLLNVARQEEKERADKNKIEFENDKEQRGFISSNLKSVLQKHLKKEEFGILKKETITKVENINELFKDLISEFEKMKKIDIQNMDYNNIKNFEKELMNDKTKLVKVIETLDNDNRKLEKENKILKEQQENFVKNFGDFKTKFIEIEQENNKYKDFILQNNLNKNFENFGKIEDKDNNLPFNFSRA